MRSTSPPKSAWPGVSTMLIRVSFQSTEVALARMVMPRSFSMSFEVHRAFIDALIFAERTGLFQERVDERRFAMVYVRDDRDISDLHVASRGCCRRSMVRRCFFGCAALTCFFADAKEGRRRMRQSRGLEPARAEWMPDWMRRWSCGQHQAKLSCVPTIAGRRLPQARLRAYSRSRGILRDTRMKGRAREYSATAHLPPVQMLHRRCSRSSDRLSASEPPRQNRSRSG